MQIGAVGFSPFVYNTNAVSSASMNKVSSIGKDALASKTDFSGLTLQGENQNPLKKGQTANWADVLSMQMEMSQRNAARIMKPAEDATETASQAVTATAPTASSAQSETTAASTTQADTTAAATTQADSTAASVAPVANLGTPQIQAVDTNASASQAMNNNQQFGSAMMQRAADAYMSMMMVS